MFTNLFRNAMHSIDQKRQRSGIIAVVASVKDDIIQIRINDNGIGIPDVLKDILFDFNVTTKGRKEGTGLGLGISRRLVRQCGGDIILESSTEGVGSTFLVTLPFLHNLT